MADKTQVAQQSSEDKSEPTKSSKKKGKDKKKKDRSKMTPQELEIDNKK